MDACEALDIITEIGDDRRVTSSFVGEEENMQGRLIIDGPYDLVNKLHTLLFLND